MNTQLDTKTIDFGAVVSKKPTSTRFILVRHGETDWNKEKRFQGHIDIALNAHGTEQARLVRRYFDELEATGLLLYQQCVSSDLDRARTTADLIHDQKTTPVQLHADLRERHYGHLAGLTGDEMSLKSPEEFASLRNRQPEAQLEGGESLRQFYDRVVLAFKEIANANQGACTLLVAHGGVLDCIYRYCAGEPLDKQRDWQLPNCALNIVELDSEGHGSVLLWAWQGHLNKGLPGQNMDEVDGRVA